MQGVSDPVLFKPKATVEAELVRGDVKQLLDYVEARDCIGMAAVMIHSDGTSSVQVRGKGCRTLLLGAVTDLQFSIARDGDS